MQQSRLTQFFRSVPPLYYALLLIGLYIALACVRLRLPGAQYDELSFTNTALGAKYSAFADTKLFGHPVLILPYLTSLKAYLYWPIFKLFGVSILTIRLPIILLSASGLWLLFTGLRRVVGERFAVLILLLLFADSTFISLTRFDVGFTAIDLFAKLGALCCLWFWLSTKRPLYFAGLLAALALGVFHKLNFIWFINSLTFSSLLVYHTTLRKLLGNWRKHWRLWLGLVVSFGLDYGFYLFLSKKFNLKSSVSLQAIHTNLPIFHHLLPGTINGQAFFGYLLGTPATTLNRIYFWGMAGLLLLGAVFFWRCFHQIAAPLRRLYVFSWLMVVTTLAQILVTSEANAPWHYFAIYPFSTLLIGCSIYVTQRWLRQFSRRWAQATAGLLIVGIVIYQLATFGGYIAQLDTTQNWYWSGAIYNLSNYTKGYQGHVVSVDWGLHTQLLTFDYQPGKYAEAWEVLYAGASPATDQRFAAQFLQSPDTTIFVKFNPQRPPQPQHVKLDPYAVTNQSFYQVVYDLGYQLQTLKQITNSQGQTVYEIYRLVSPSVGQ